MKHVISRRGFNAGVLAAAPLAAAMIGRGSRADEPMRLRCSLDTAPTHGRNVSIADYLKKVEDASGGRIKAEIFHSGSLFADLDVGKALIQGQVEMAAPGCWTITGIIPAGDFVQLPAMYGQPMDVIHRIIDGRAGALVNEEINNRLRAHVLGPWIDLGYQNLYSAKVPLNAVADIKGLKVRSPGGAGAAWRLRFWGAIANTTAWPQVPLALSQGTFDALISTNESLATAQLWEAGVRFSLEDHNFIGEYIPMVSNAFWNKLPADLQATMTRLWAENIPTYRAAMAERQTKARALMESKGVKFVDPTAQETHEARAKMLVEQDEMAKLTKLPPEIVKLVMADAGGAA